MPTPTFTSITPVEGVTLGRERLTIEGLDFDLPPDPFLTPGPLGDQPDPVAVTIDGQRARRVAVYPKPGATGGEIIIECDSPVFMGNGDDLPKAVDVVIENLLTSGSVTASGVFTYRKVCATEESILTTVCRAFTLDMRRHLPLKRVIIRTHTDHDSDVADTIDSVDLSRVPALIVPEIATRDSEGIFTVPPNAADIGGDEFEERFSSKPKDVIISLTLVDENLARLLNLVSLTKAYIDERGKLPVEDVEGDPSQGITDFDMSISGDFIIDTRGRNNNIITALGSVTIYGVAMARPGFLTLDRGLTALEVVIGYEGKE